MALTINNPRYGNIFVVADTFAELRSVSSKQIQNGYSAIVAGDLEPGDGFGGMLVWNSTSTAPDNNRTTIAPQDGQRGRWIKISVGQVGPQGEIGPIGLTGGVGPQGDGIATVMAPGGSALVGYSGRTVADKLNETISVRDYGATGNGGVQRLSTKYATLAAAQIVYPFVTSLQQTLDYAGIQAALHAARDSGVRKLTVYVPAGRYLISDTLRMASNVTLRGDPGSSIIDNQNFPLGTAQLTNDDPVAFQYTHISGMAFNGGRHGILIDAQTTEGNTLEDCTFALQSASNYQCERLYQTSTMTRCVLAAAPYGLVINGAFCNQNSFYSCEFNSHTEGSIRITGSGEGVHFLNCRSEAGGRVGKSTISLNNCRSFRWVGGYIEGTHTYALAETGSTGSTSFESVHFTGSSDGVSGFAPYLMVSDGMVTITNSHASFPVKIAANTLLIGNNPNVQGSSLGAVWRYKDAFGGKVRLRQRNPRSEATQDLLSFTIPAAGVGGRHTLTGILTLQFVGIDATSGVGRASYRTYHVSVASTGGGSLLISMKPITAMDEAVGPITIALQAKASPTTTSAILQVVYTNVIATNDAYSVVAFQYDAMTDDDTNPLLVTAL